MTFGEEFSKCMSGMGLPAPTGLFESAAEAADTIKLLAEAAAGYSAATTIAEIVALGGLSGAFEVIGAVTVAAYVGVCGGCVIQAGIESAIS